MLLQLSKTATVADHRSQCIVHVHTAHKLILRLTGSLRLHAYPVHWHYRWVLQNKQKIHTHKNQMYKNFIAEPKHTKRLLTPSLPWCHLKTTNNRAKIETLSVFFFAPACETIFIKTHSTKSRCVIGLNIYCLQAAAVEGLKRSWF